MDIEHIDFPQGDAAGSGPRSPEYSSLADARSGVLPPIAIAPPHDPGYPLYAVEEGTIEVMGHTLRTALLNNGERVVLAEDAEKFFHEMGMNPL